MYHVTGREGNTWRLSEPPETESMAALQLFVYLFGPKLVLVVS